MVKLCGCEPISLRLVILRYFDAKIKREMGAAELLLLAEDFKKELARLKAELTELQTEHAELGRMLGVVPGKAS